MLRHKRQYPQRAQVGLTMVASAKIKRLRAAMLACILTVIVFGFTNVSASAADLRVMSGHAKAHRYLKRISYTPCRTGWWQSYCDGKPTPRWVTRCR